MNDPFDPKRSPLKELIFRHMAEVLMLSGLILLLMTAIAPVYERSVLRAKVASSYHNLNDLVEALQVYSHEQPASRIFPPDMEMLLPGINLCPIPEPAPGNLLFLTTPTAYLAKVPFDPFTSQILQKSDALTPFVTHWVKAGNEHSLMASEYSNIGWGAFSIGPSLSLPPQYSITILRRVPYENGSLRANLFSPSNGLTSLGLVYKDSLGNRAPQGDEM